MHQKPFHQIVALRYDAYAGTEFSQPAAANSLDSDSVDVDAPRRRGRESIDGAEERRLSGTAGTEDRYTLRSANLQRDALEHLGAAAVSNYQVTDLKQVAGGGQRKLADKTRAISTRGRSSAPARTRRRRPAQSPCREGCREWCHPGLP